MAAPLLVLPPRIEAPIVNMATDMWMLRTFPQPESPRFRHFGWDRPCHTFGYSQSFEWVSRQTGTAPESLCRRPSGGGVVDHRDDWTYALVIPSGHAAAAGQIRSSYHGLHRALGEAMTSLGAPTALIGPPTEKGGHGDFPSTPGHCFEEPVVHDLSLPNGGPKIAGAAMKKGREGLLLQGSIQRNLLGPFPWEQLPAAFAGRIAAFLDTTEQPGIWPVGLEKARQPFLEEMTEPAWQCRPSGS